MEIDLDYEGAREIARKACLRAACFMGFALNAARNEEFTDITLCREVNINFVPPNLAPEKVAEIKREFEAWVIVNGLRELIEGFAVYLDHLYEFSLLVTMTGKPIGQVEERKISEVKQKGLPGKQKTLRDEFNIVSEHSSALRSLYEARNCLSHERGIVSPAFCNENDALVVRWNVIELFAKLEDGSERILHPVKNAAPVFGPAQILKRVVVRAKRFRVGEVVRLDVKDLAEICVFAFLVCDSFLFPALEFAKLHGIRER